MVEPVASIPGFDDGCARGLTACAHRRWPIDANSIMPSFERQLKRIRAETDYVDQRKEANTMEKFIQDAAGRARHREVSRAPPRP